MAVGCLQIGLASFGTRCPRGRWAWDRGLPCDRDGNGGKPKAIEVGVNLRIGVGDQLMREKVNEVFSKIKVTNRSGGKDGGF